MNINRIVVGTPLERQAMRKLCAPQYIEESFKIKPKAKETNEINSYFTKTLKTSGKTFPETPKTNAFVKVLKNIINVFKHIR